MQSLFVDRRGVYHAVSVQAATVFEAVCRASAIFIQALGGRGPDLGGGVRCTGPGEAEYVSGENGRHEEMAGAEWQESEGVDGEETVERDAKRGTH
jgi:hypothetical protein